MAMMLPTLGVIGRCRDDNPDFGVQPELRKVRAGWMAMTPEWHPYRIGVIEATKDQARAHFRESMAAWKRLHEAKE